MRDKPKTVRTPRGGAAPGAELERLREDSARRANWKRFGPYLAERQWATVREDYSEQGTCWEYFPHDHARSRAYRWGEDGLLGITDREGRICFALALWNESDPMLKERLFGLSGPEGNHGEDCKELYYYLDSTPTHSYLKALYKYPQAEFPYARLVEENQQRGRDRPEYELADTGTFDAGRYFDVLAEYAKASPDDILIKITVANRGPESARIHVLPTLWFRNTWSWGRTGEGYWSKPSIRRSDERELCAEHQSLGTFGLAIDRYPGGADPEFLFTDNETNQQRLYDTPNHTPWVKDAFHDYVVNGKSDAVNPAGKGTKAAAHCVLDVPAGGEVVLRLRLFAAGAAPASRFSREFDQAFARRVAEANEFYEHRFGACHNKEQRRVARQACAGLLWSKQFYHYSVKEWLEGDPAQPAPPEARRRGRNSDWHHLYNRDVISMPDKWEYPWYAAWDLAFHMIPFARLDPDFSKQQLVLFLREWFMHPSGKMPAYEFAFGDVNPPVHAWAVWRVYKMTAPKGKRDRVFLARCFQKLLINFTWWVNRKDVDGKHLFSGGFLGLDNIGIFDRSKPLPTGGTMTQADGTAWMAFYCVTMLSMALELAKDDPAYEDVASKFFEHFVAIADAMNTLGGTGLWDEHDGFYYDQLLVPGQAAQPMRIRSTVGIIPLFAAEVLEQETIDKLPGFKKRMEWFLQNRPDLARCISYAEHIGQNGHRLLAIPSRERLVRVLRYVLDENELLSPHGVRSLSRVHRHRPFTLKVNGEEHRVEYVPGESSTGLFGGNSNWRGPVWFPVNWLLIEALERYHHFYGDTFTIEYPTGSGNRVTLQEVATDLARRMAALFAPDTSGRRPCHGEDPRYAHDPHFQDLVLFHEYFHGEHGQGLGASHQTGWTALVVSCLDSLARNGSARAHATAR